MTPEEFKIKIEEVRTLIVEKLVEARRRGVSEQEIATDSYNHRDNPYAAPGWGPPGLNLQPPPGLELTTKVTDLPL